MSTPDRVAFVWKLWCTSFSPLLAPWWKISWKSFGQILRRKTTEGLNWWNYDINGHYVCIWLKLIINKEIFFFKNSAETFCNFQYIFIQIIAIFFDISPIHFSERNVLHMLGWSSWSFGAQIYDMKSIVLPTHYIWPSCTAPSTK